ATRPIRMSASGLESTIAVAIDQILRLAPSSRPPIEPVVSSTKATSTAGFARAGEGPADRDRAVRARAKAGVAMRGIVRSPPVFLSLEAKVPLASRCAEVQKGRATDKFVAGVMPDLASLLGGRREIG